MPSGCAVLADLGVDLDAFPRLRGVEYRVAGAGTARGEFTERPGRGVRRLAFNELLARRAASTVNVDARFGCEITTLQQLKTRFIVGADGLRSTVARAMGWSRPPKLPHRYALCGHAPAPNHGVDRVVVTILKGREVYTCPSGPDELLVAVLGRGHAFRDAGESVRAAFERTIKTAHPELDTPAVIRGAGPVWTRPATVADRGVFLLGDAAGFLDPLTGDGMSDGLVAARELATIIARDEAEPERAYRRWESRQWRRRLFVNRLALTLTGRSTLARRALIGVQRRSQTLDRLLAINDGTLGVSSLSPRDWAALVGV
jgi:2-polyprenyl-6-methoxyphenol hydroxylase-like FAD-dependent oxidoreductase